MVGGLSKNVGHHGCPTTKKKQKKTLANALKEPPKKEILEQKLNDSKPHICNSFFENIISGMQRF